MPRLWIMSDLHLDAVPHPEAFRPVRPAFDVLVVAGDVWEGSSARALSIVAGLADGKSAAFVMGNHEPWNRDLDRERAVARRAADRHGIALLDDSTATVSGIRLVGGTLWADGLLAGRDAMPARATGEPVRVTHDGGTRPITGADAAALHRRTLQAIEMVLAGPRDGCPVVVVTHHAPHPLCLPTGQRTGWAAGNAESDLSHLTDTGMADAWVHGHVHATVDLTRPGGTRVVCNAAAPGFTNSAFRDGWTVEI